MNNEKMGRFISELRKSHQMTQKQLAEKMNISDKAVSKWERGLSCPDISLLSTLSDILDVTITELLNGERSDKEDIDLEISVDNALEYGENTKKIQINSIQSISAAVFTIFILIGVSVVSVVNVAVSGTFTWSLIPIISSIFIWLIFFPVIKLGTRGIVCSLGVLSILMIPFLYVLDYAINRITEKNYSVFTLGVSIAPLSIVYIWLAYFLFKKYKNRKLFAVACLVLAASPLNFLINCIIAKVEGWPIFSMQNITNTLTTAIAATILFVIEHAKREHKQR